MKEINIYPHLTDRNDAVESCNLWLSTLNSSLFQFQITFSDYLWILLPICVDENHWVLLAANKSTRSVGILNSLPGYSAAEERYCSHFMYVLHFLLFHIKDMGTCMYVKGGGWGIGCGGGCCCWVLLWFFDCWQTGEERDTGHSCQGQCCNITLSNIKC